MAGTHARDRKRRKRKEKRTQMRRAQTGSPYQRVARQGGGVTCYVNEEWQERGMASLYCVRAAPGGGYALASFLVDIWCIGLKDAWGRLDLNSEDIAEMRERAQQGDMHLVRLEPDIARRLVAGGIRFARRNGFRLPKHYHRWVAILGDIGDEETADIGMFGKDGGLFYVGTEQALRQRLIGSTLEAFVARKDVKVIIGPYTSGEWSERGISGGDGWTIVKDDGTIVEEADWAERSDEEDETDEDDEGDFMFDQALVAGVRRWCFSNGIPPQPRLDEAWRLLSLTTLDWLALGDSAFNVDDYQLRQVKEMLEKKADIMTPQATDEVLAAVSQIHGFMSSFETAEDMEDYVAEVAPEF